MHCCRLYVPLEAARVKVQSFLSTTTEQNILILAGSLGTGKSMLANDVARSLPPGNASLSLQTTDANFENNNHGKVAPQLVINNPQSSQALKKEIEDRGRAVSSHAQDASARAASTTEPDSIDIWQAEGVKVSSSSRFSIMTICFILPRGCSRHETTSYGCGLCFLIGLKSTTELTLERISFGNLHQHIPKLPWTSNMWPMNKQYVSNCMWWWAIE